MADGLKRIMSFDGGGIRGIFALQIAARIEQLFRESYGQKNLVLADVIDLFAGTSTGAIIATFLAWGHPVAEVEKLYIDHGRQMFARQWFWQWIKAKYRADRIAEFFRNEFQEADGSAALLDSKKLKTLLLVVMRNATTGSPWPICSNPNAKFNLPNLADCNLKIPLWKLLRASTAAPTFFPPEEITLGSKKFLFVDGGVTPYNNPSLLAVLMATLPCYRLNWPVGPSKIHLTSIGTGEQRTHIAKALAAKVYLWDHLRFVIPGLIGAFSANQDMLCRILGHCLHGTSLDAELGCLETPSLLAEDEQKFSYARYNCRLDTSDLGQSLSAGDLKLDNIKAIPKLIKCGQTYAEQSISRSQLML